MKKAMATHSSTLAWKIPWMEETGGLQPVGSHRVGHDWSDLAAAAVLPWGPPEILWEMAKGWETERTSKWWWEAVRYALCSSCEPLCTERPVKSEDLWIKSGKSHNFELYQITLAKHDPLLFSQSQVNLPTATGNKLRLLFLGLGCSSTCTERRECRMVFPRKI